MKFVNPRRLGQSGTMSTNTEKSRAEEASLTASKYAWPSGMKNTTCGHGFRVQGPGSSVWGLGSREDEGRSGMKKTTFGDGGGVIDFISYTLDPACPIGSDMWCGVCVGGWGGGTICCVMVVGFWHLSSQENSRLCRA